MSTPLSARQEHRVAALVNRAQSQIGPLLARGVPASWEPGLRRPAMLSDLLRALAGLDAADASFESDPWAVPSGRPDGADSWTSPEAAGDRFGFSQVINAPVSLMVGRNALDTTFTRSSDIAPLALRLRRWHGTDRHWDELSAMRPVPGRVGNRGLAIVNLILDPAQDAPPNRCGALLVLPTAGRDSVTLTALVAVGAASDLDPWASQLIELAHTRGLVSDAGRDGLGCGRVDEAARGKEGVDPAPSSCE